MDEPPVRGVDATTLVVSLTLVLVGAGVLGGLVYADRTATLAADYAAFSENCESLEGEANLVEDGLGMSAETLNGSAVRACENTTFEAYRRGRIRSMQTAPLNLFQWLWFGGAGVVLVAGGVALFRRESGE